MLGTELESSATAARALNHWDISTAQHRCLNWQKIHTERLWHRSATISTALFTLEGNQVILGDSSDSHKDCNSFDFLFQTSIIFVILSTLDMYIRAHECHSAHVEVTGYHFVKLVFSLSLYIDFGDWTWLWNLLVSSERVSPMLSLKHRPSRLQVCSDSPASVSQALTLLSRCNLPIFRNAAALQVVREEPAALHKFLWQLPCNYSSRYILYLHLWLMGSMAHSWLCPFLVLP